MAERPLEGQVALITGGAKRIGRSITLRLAADGAAVVINYASSQSEAEALVREIETGNLSPETSKPAKQAKTKQKERSGARRRAMAVRADVSQRPQVQKMFAAVEKQFGRLDILVNNAGVFFAAKFQDLTDEQWDRILDTNLKSQFLCAQAAAPIMKRHGRGRIINISSLGGLLPWPSYTHYCVSKAGVIMLTRCLARALAPEILVNSVAPGTIQFPGEAPDEDYIKRVPLHRTGRGEDIAGAVAYLSTADFLTGQIIAVDGGRTLV
jgi:NAD(P)-dependent dehydrogenase (short-subunit alcohol dehydrogenase family)